eukprot:8889707-Alexandrium_andersonii.AAC.1
MSASLVGSEMCIRDSPQPPPARLRGSWQPRAPPWGSFASSPSCDLRFGHVAVQASTSRQRSTRRFQVRSGPKRLLHKGTSTFSHAAARARASHQQLIWHLQGKGQDEFLRARCPVPGARCP